MFSFNQIKKFLFLKKTFTELNLFNNIIGLISFWLLIVGCDDLPFSLQENQSSKPKEQKTKGVNSFYTVYKNSSVPKDASSFDNKNPVLEKSHPIVEEITHLTEDRELTEDTVIHSKTVVLNGITVKTSHYNLIVKADEFISNNAIIQNFPEGQTASKRKDGRNGGHILIEAATAKGNLQLILNGEQGGLVPKRHLSKKEHLNLKGENGEEGKGAVYKILCQKDDPHLWLQVARHIIETNGTPPALRGLSHFLVTRLIGEQPPCFEVCLTPPTKGIDGEKGRSGLKGFDGKRGGHSGSFHLRAFDLSGFQLTNVQNTPGTGSEGGEGTPGGLGGKGGHNGRDEKSLCTYNLLLPKNGQKGKPGPKGKAGLNGEKGTVCLERLIPNYEATNPESPSQREGEITCY